MSWAIVAAAGIGAAASIGGSYLGSKAQKEAAKEATELEYLIARENIDFQRELNEEQRGDFAPWRDVGEQALEQLWSGVQAGDFEVGDIDVTRDPGYQFRMDEGIKALDQSAAARGRLLSGAQQKGLTKYAQNVASDEYARAYAREADEKTRRFNILSGLSSSGQASAARQAAATSQLAQTGGNILSNLGQSQAQAALAAGQARAGAYQSYGQSVNQAAQNWALMQALKEK